MTWSGLGYPAFALWLAGAGLWVIPSKSEPVFRWYRDLVGMFLLLAASVMWVFSDIAAADYPPATLGTGSALFFAWALWRHWKHRPPRNRRKTPASARAEEIITRMRRVMRELRPRPVRVPVPA